MNRQIEIAWAAGLFEGEGTIVLFRDRTRLRVQLAVEMTDEDVVRRFFRVSGFGSVQYILPKNGCKQKWKWFGSGQCAVLLLSKLAPHFGTRRRNRTLVALNAYTDYCNGNKPRRQGGGISRGQQRKTARIANDTIT
jgi:hypothetical protein